MKKYVFWAMFTVATVPVFAQWHFGVKMDYLRTNPQIDLTESDFLGSTYTSMTSSGGLGFALGILAKYDLSNRFRLCTQPSINFGKSTLELVTTQDVTTSYDHETVDVAVPLQLEVVFPKIPLQPYLIGGGQIRYYLTPTELDSNTAIANEGQGTAVFAGLGLEFPIPKANAVIHPEVIYQFDVSNKIMTSDVFSGVSFSDYRVDVLALRLCVSGM